MSQFFSTSVLALSLIFSVFTNQAKALDLDWHGQLRTETNWIYGYSHGKLLAAGAGDQGYFIPSNGDSPASFQNLFLRLTPRVIVNDNVSIYSNLWFGTPDKSIFGGNQPNTSTVNQTNTGNATISASTFYAEVATDFGTFTVGRVPLNWGLGVIWNTNTDGFDRMPSTADGFRLETKLGAFKFAPAMYKYRAGSNYGGSGSFTAGTSDGTSTATDYSVALTYNNDDEQMDLGLLFLRRLAGLNAGIVDPFSTTATTTGYAYNVWDFFVKKKSGIFTVSAEVPIVTGLVGNKTYSTVAGAAKVDAQVDDHWKLKLNGGMAGGQESLAVGATSTKLTSFYFHPDYRPGLLMFNYNMRNLSDGASSPFNNPVTNAQFVSLGFDYNSNKWTHGVQFLTATSSKTAEAAAGSYFNTQDGHYQTKGATGAQEKGLGTEIDYSLGYDWDESMKLGLTMGLYMPGKFYEFSKSATLNEVKTAFGTGLNLLVKF